SLALDYHLAGGLDTFWFHLDVFVWDVVLLAMIYALYVSVLDRAAPGPQNRYVALFAVAWFGLHPASAETINYMYQRGDLYSTLGVVTGIVTYAAWPQWRSRGFYLIPALL